MEIRIGIKQSPRELSFESDASAEEVRSLVEDRSSESGSLISLSDVKGRHYLVDIESIAYIELGGESSRKIGFVG